MEKKKKRERHKEKKKMKKKELAEIREEEVISKSRDNFLKDKKKDTVDSSSGNKGFSFTHSFTPTEFKDDLTAGSKTTTSTTKTTTATTLLTTPTSPNSNISLTPTAPLTILSGVSSTLELSQPTPTSSPPNKGRKDAQPSAPQSANAGGPPIVILPSKPEAKTTARLTQSKGSSGSKGALGFKNIHSFFSHTSSSSSGIDYGIASAKDRTTSSSTPSDSFTSSSSTSARNAKRLESKDRNTTTKRTSARISARDNNRTYAEMKEDSEDEIMIPESQENPADSKSSDNEEDDSSDSSSESEESEVKVKKKKFRSAKVFSSEDYRNDAYDPFNSGTSSTSRENSEDDDDDYRPNTKKSKDTTKKGPSKRVRGRGRARQVSQSLAQKKKKRTVST